MGSPSRAGPNFAYNPPLGTDMTSRSSPLLLALACAGALQSSPAAAADPDADAKAAADLDAALAGLSTPAIGPEQRKLLARYAQGDFCYCGCPHTVASCLLGHHACKHAARQARLAAAVAGSAGATVEAIRDFVTRYYASFDRRARIDLAAYGPPLGDERAPVTLVEYSDFTCPFCQSFRPALEAFVAAHPGRVKLYFKPFPIESHPGALDAAIAAEWGRKQGAFWKLHDALFSLPAHDLDSMADAAEELGLDASDLRDAVTSRRFEKQVRASQSEGRLADVHGTPTLYMNGRLLSLPANDSTWLEFTLEDEEEWIRNKGKWDRD
jgi:predicted DsbA family dithiol-disulfide isomerase